MNEEIQYLKEHLDAICRYKGLQEELTYNVPLEILKRVCIVLDYLQQKNKELKEIHYLIQGGRGNGKTYLTKLEQENARLKEENKALHTLVEWAEECGFGFDNFTDDAINWEEFEEESKNMDYIESMIYYAKKYNQIQELESDIK